MNLEDLTVPVLKKLIRAYNLHTIIKGYSTMNKIDLIKNIKKHFRISDNNLRYKEHSDLNVSEELKYKQVRKAKATTPEIKKEIKKVVKEVKKELAPEIKKKLKEVKEKKKFDKNLKEKVKEQKKQSEKIIVKEVKKIVKKAPEKTVEEAVKEVVLQKPVVLQKKKKKEDKEDISKTVKSIRRYLIDLVEKYREELDNIIIGKYRGEPDTKLTDFLRQIDYTVDVQGDENYNKLVNIEKLKKNIEEAVKEIVLQKETEEARAKPDLELEKLNKQYEKNEKARLRRIERNKEIGIEPSVKRMFQPKGYNSEYFRKERAAKKQLLIEQYKLRKEEEKPKKQIRKVVKKTADGTRYVPLQKPVKIEKVLKSKYITPSEQQKNNISSYWIWNKDIYNNFEEIMNFNQDYLTNDYNVIDDKEIGDYLDGLYKLYGNRWFLDNSYNKWDRLYYVISKDGFTRLLTKYKFITSSDPPQKLQQKQFWIT